MAGRITAIDIREGERFKKDQALVKFDCEIQRSHLKKAQAKLLAARKTHESNQQLMSYESIGELEVDLSAADVQSALADAQSMALGKDHNFIEPVHLLSALLDQQGGSSRPLLQKAGVDLAGLAAGVAAAVDELPTVSGTGGDVHISNDLGRILNVTDKLAQ